METIKDVLLTYLTKLLLPNSPAYGNSIPFVKEDALSDAISQVQVGDVILTKTNNSLYQGVRQLLNTEYDHISIVINQKQVIHVSPPIISKLQIQRILQKTRQPLIYRFPLENKEILLNILNNFLGERYNEKAIFELLKRQIENRLNMPEHHNFSLQTIKYSRICSDAILYALCRSSQKLSNSISNFSQEKTKYCLLGYFLPSEVGTFLEENGASIIFRSPENNSKTLLDRASWIHKYFEGLRSEIQPYFKILKQIPLKKNNSAFLYNLVNSKVLKMIIFKSSPQFRILTVTYLLYSLLLKNSDNLHKSKQFIFKFLYWIAISNVIPNLQLLPKL